MCLTPSIRCTREYILDYFRSQAGKSYEYEQPSNHKCMFLHAKRAGNRYSQLLFASEYRLCSKLCVQEQSKNIVLHTPVVAAIEWTISGRFPEKLEVNLRIWNQILVNRLTTISSKITMISWWEMLVNFRWILFRLSWQISRLTFKCKHVQLTWLPLLHPANEARLANKFSSIN